MEVRIKRVYEAVQEEDGIRVLIDRLWPRGISKEAAQVDFWIRNVAPSSELRKWFGHVPERFDEFRVKYIKELETDPEKIAALMDLSRALKGNKGTLIYAAKDTVYNHAVVLKDFLKKYKEEA